MRRWPISDLGALRRLYYSLVRNCRGQRQDLFGKLGKSDWRQADGNKRKWFVEEHRSQLIVEYLKDLGSGCLFGIPKGLELGVTKKNWLTDPHKPKT